MSERFVYYSSIGFCIMIAYGLVMILSWKKLGKYFSYGIFSIILLLYGFKTIDRNPAWYNDYTLFTTDVKTSANSAKSNCSAGGILFESLDTIHGPSRKAMVINQSIGYLRKAIAIHPTYNDALLLLGNVYLAKENGIDSAVWCYAAILKNSPNHENASKNMMVAVNRENNIDKKIDILHTLVLLQPNNFEPNYMLGKLLGKEKNDLDKAVVFLGKAISINPNSKDALVDLGVAYGMKKNYHKSAEMLERAVVLSPNEANILINLGVTYQLIGDLKKAGECFKKAELLRN